MDGRQTTKGLQTGWSGGAPSLESLRELRLKALLADVMDELGQVGAAEKLGIDRKTLWRCRRSGKLTPRLSDALERMLLAQGLSAAMRQGERVTELERQVTELQRELRGVLDAVEGLRDEEEEGRAGTMRRFERRLARLEAGNDSQAGSEPGPEKRGYVPGRQYPQLVTLEAEPGEEGVYGDATPVIVEWREARAVFMESLKTGSALSRAVAYERVLELELVLIDVHEMTLPPRTYPWDAPDRLEQVERRKETLRQTRSDRAGAERRRRLRRVLTFGLWRS